MKHPIIRYSLRCLFFVMPLLLLGGEALLSHAAFCFRPWEALRFAPDKDIPFYPNTDLEMDAQGDLCYYTPYAEIRKERWHTDKIGFRNDTFTDHPDIVLLGDSFLAGAGLTQNETLTNRLEEHKKSKVRYYNMAPATIYTFCRLFEQGMIAKPKIVIMLYVESTLPNELKSIKLDYTPPQNTDIAKDRATRGYALRYLWSRLEGKRGCGIQSTVNPNLFFLRGKAAPEQTPQVRDMTRIIASYKRYFDKRGIRFIYIPIPNKESVYYDQVPLAAPPDYLGQLTAELAQHKVETLELLPLFLRYKSQHPGQWLYRRDDTHWSSVAVELTEREITRYLDRTSGRP